MTIPMKAQGAMARFEASRESLNAFRKDNARVVEEFELLQADFEKERDNVKEIYRDNHEEIGTTFGDFSARYTIKVDGQALLDKMGDKALAMGLVVMTPEVDRKKYDEAVKEGKISVEVIQAAETTPPPSITAPKPPSSVQTGRKQRK